MTKVCASICSVNFIKPVQHNPITATANGTDCNRCEFEDYRSRFSTSQLFPFFFVFVPTECYRNGKAALSCVSFRLENEKSFSLNPAIVASVVRIHPNSRTRARTAKQFLASTSHLSAFPAFIRILKRKKYEKLFKFGFQRESSN